MPDDTTNRTVADAPGGDQVPAEIVWEDGDTPLSVQFDDPYFAREDGRAETRHVFLGGNGLPGRWQGRRSFTVAELGFGTGLNFFETLVAWQRAPGTCERLTFVSFERYPLSGADLARSLAPWADLSESVAQLLAHWPPTGDVPILRIHFGTALLELHVGDANAKLRLWEGTADAWYLDGFSPAKNADMWGEDLMRCVYARTAAGGTFSTFTAAGWVRRNLIAAGFDVQKVPGYGRKRESLAGSR